MDRDYESVVFCDFDGVVTSIAGGTYFAIDPNKYGYEERLVDRLLKFCDETYSKIIMVSNWRKFADDGEWRNTQHHATYKNPLPKFFQRIGNYCLGKIPPYRHMNKCDALKKWIDETGFNLPYVILEDDENEMYQYEDMFIDKLILTDCNFGFGLDDYRNAKYSLLKQKEKIHV